MNVTHQAALLQQILGQEADELARETGFIQRKRAFSGADFAQALILGWLQEPNERVEGFVQIFGRREVTITASGLCQRFTKEAATFLQRLLERLAEVRMQAEAVDIALLRRFSGVMVEDSSSVMLPAALAEVWRGCGGHEGTSEAAIKLFVRWDVLRGTLEGPRLTDGRHNDSKSPFNEDELPVGGLYLADLGFFSQQRLSHLARRPGGGKRFFVMRLHWGTRLTTRGGHQIELRGIVPRRVGEAIELGVLLGKQARLPVRLLLIRVSEEVAEQRRKRLRETALTKHPCHGPPLPEGGTLTPGVSSLELNDPRLRIWKVKSAFSLNASMLFRQESAPEAAAQDKQSGSETSFLWEWRPMTGMFGQGLFGQYGFDAALGPICVCSSYRIPTGACFFAPSCVLCAPCFLTIYSRLRYALCGRRTRHRYGTTESLSARSGACARDGPVLETGLRRVLHRRHCAVYRSWPWQSL